MLVKVAPGAIISASGVTLIMIRYIVQALDIHADQFQLSYRI